MKIKEILTQHRRDFEAIYICEHCQNERKGSGYDDANFHQNVIPNMECLPLRKDIIFYALRGDVIQNSYMGF